MDATRFCSFSFPHLPFQSPSSSSPPFFCCRTCRLRLQALAHVHMPFSYQIQPPTASRPILVWLTLSRFGTFQRCESWGMGDLSLSDHRSNPALPIVLFYRTHRDPVWAGHVDTAKMYSRLGLGLIHINSLPSLLNCSVQNVLFFLFFLLKLLEVWLPRYSRHNSLDQLGFLSFHLQLRCYFSCPLHPRARQLHFHPTCDLQSSGAPRWSIRLFQ